MLSQDALEHALVLCADEKSQIRALDRTNSGLVHRDLFPARVVERQLVAQLIQDLFERRTLHFEPAKKRLTAEPEFFGDEVHASPGPPGLMACCDAELPSAVLTAPAEL